MSYYDNEVVGMEQTPPCKEALEAQVAKKQKIITADAAMIDAMDHFFAIHGNHVMRKLQLETAYAVISQNNKHAQDKLDVLIKRIEAMS